MTKLLLLLFAFFFSVCANSAEKPKEIQQEQKINEITPSISMISKDETNGNNAWTNFNLQHFGANLFQGNFDKVNFTGFNPNYAISQDDEILVHFWGAKTAEITTKVDQQGNIFVPEVGNINVLNVLQKDLNTHITNKIRKVYNKNVGVYTQLASSKKVKVFVSGFVNKPGLYEGMASGSVFSYIDSAGGIDLSRGSFRKITVIRGNKTLHTFDLYSFLLGGNIDFIQLHEGDVIKIGEQGGVISVTGQVKNQNKFELKNAKTLGQEVINYANPLDFATNVHIIRKTKESTQNFFLTIDEFKNFDVVFEDKIEFFAHSLPETITIIVEGEHKGKKRLVLPYNKTTIQDAIAMIEPSERSAMNDIILYREAAAIRQKQVFNQVLDNLEQKFSTYSPISTEDAQIHQEEAGMIKSFIQKARNHQPNGMISLYNDNGKLSSIHLEDRDIIHIPKLTNLVATFGYVNSPTYIPFEKGEKIKYYVEASGGFSNGADEKSFLVRKLNGTVIKVTASYKPKEGDEIIILPKISFKKFQFAKDVSQVLYQMITSTAITARLLVLL